MGARYGIVSGDEVAVSVSVPDWDAREERSVIAKVVRERVRFFGGESDVKPLFLERGSLGWLARYRVNFMSGVGGERVMLGSAYVVVVWCDCSGSTPGKSCWEPEVRLVNFARVR